MKKRARKELSFRRAMPVRETVFFTRGDYTYPRCPRCKLTMDREYVRFCDRCGQRLDWSTFEEADVISLE